VTCETDDGLNELFFSIAGMGPKRGAAGGRGRARSPRRPVRRPARDEDDIPEVYQDMLAEAARNPLPKPDVQTRSAKRRKLDVGSPQVLMADISLDDAPSSRPADAENGYVSDGAPRSSQKQIVYDDFGASDEDSDEDFEDVELEADADEKETQEGPDEPLQLDLSKKPGPDIGPSISRRKPATGAERKLRLDVHKWHVLCLLAHLQRRNHWCDDDQVQAILKPLIPRKLVKLLHLDASQSQSQRTYSFNSVIDEISKIWRSEWKTTEPGLRRAYWREDSMDLEDLDDFSDPVDLDDFRTAATTKSGSRDLGAQLFGALLRSVAVDTRLVFSLQPLPFSGVAKGMTPEKPKPEYIMASSIGRQPTWDQNDGASTPPKPGLRLYDAEPPQSNPSPPPKRTSNKIKDSPYPIFWVEVFSEPLQKWIPLDPLVRHTINKPKTGFEPPASDPLNQMSYVLAFEDDGSAKDVTRRYAQFYNAKTRKTRVESTRGGAKWWARTMAVFEKPFAEDRDAIEDAELLAREESEQMPRNVSDFKGHPRFALERHLRRNEVVHPRREVGKVSVGQSRGGRLESVFRRRDVLVVRTADQWYRLGRDVKVGEQPLKRVVLQKRRARSVEEDEDGEEGAEGAMLYAEFQAEIYVPPHVVDGKVPRNAYGNLDVYVPSMIPAGAIHAQHPDAARAARVLGIDYVDAVTGFEFKGRQGTAVLNGIVAAAEYREALVEVLEGIGYERARMNNEKRSAIALQMWKKFLIALRIRERVNTKYAEGNMEVGEEEEDDDVDDGTYHDEDDADEDEGRGGFFPEQNAGPPPAHTETGLQDVPDNLHFDPVPDIEVPIVIVESPHKLPLKQERPKIPLYEGEGAASGDAVADYDLRNVEETDGGGGFIPDDLEGGGGFMPEEADEGGGFVPDDPPHLQPTSLSTDRVAASNNAAYEPSAPSRTRLESSYRPTTPIEVVNLHKATPDPNSSSTIPSPDKASPPRSGTTLPEEHNQEAPPSPLPSTITTTNLNPFNPKPAEEDDDDADSDSDFENTSLLSHDPEDEDADPEWLAEIVESD
jgi:xeroderma pigmentosum group C-complementing protein